MIDSKMRKKFDKMFDKVGQIFVNRGLKPREITLLAFAVGLLSAFFILFRWNMIALISLWLSGFLDVMDGTVARLTKKVTASGMYMNLVFDRLIEALIILTLTVTYPRHFLGFLLFVISVLFNFTTFMIAGLIHKNNSMKGMYYDVGIVERTEVFIAFSLMLLFPRHLSMILFIINLSIFITGLLRFYRINNALIKEGN